MSNSPHVWRWSQRCQQWAQPGTPGSKTWHTERGNQKKIITKGKNKQVESNSCSLTHQFEHPRAAAACSEAAKQPENNDGGSGPDEDIWCIGGALIGIQGEVGLQAHLPPHPNGQQDHTCDLRRRAGWVQHQRAVNRAWDYKLNYGSPLKLWWHDFELHL